MTLFLGTADIDPNHPLLDKAPAAMLQGPYRLARGHNCFDAGKKLAAEHQWAFRWRVVEAPEVDHSAAKMFKHANAFDALTGG
jgi:hypothetical protein